MSWKLKSFKRDDMYGWKYMHGCFVKTDPGLYYLFHVAFNETYKQPEDGDDRGISGLTYFTHSTHSIHSTHSTHSTPSTYSTHSTHSTYSTYSART